jgi:hypothetical protein
VENIFAANPILSAMQTCGLMAPLTRREMCPDRAAAQHAWWISPQFESHPVRRIGETRYDLDPVMRALR